MSDISLKNSKRLCRLISREYISAINYGQVYTNWCIGKRIVEQEQKGETRAEYGKRVIAIASKSLTEEYGSGYSITNIKSFRKFYIEYQDYIIGQTLSAQSKGTHSIASVATNIEKGQTPSDQFANSLELLP